MKVYSQLTKDELNNELVALKAEYQKYLDMKLNLNMARGKPSAEQLDLSTDLNKEIDYIVDGFDTRNYGVLDGIPQCKELFADLMGVDTKNVIIGPSASLTLMFDYINQCFSHGVLGSTPWSKLDVVKFLCPVPGYDRHFGILEYFGIEMINVPMTSNGPDMEVVEELIKDNTVKGMICVPKYSNPSGITFSNEVVERIAALKPAASDFRIIYDNAYCVHDLGEEDELINIFDILPKYSNENMVLEFCSTAKITFPGAGVSAVIASDDNIKSILARLDKQTISYDKMNQLRHVAFLKDANGVKEHMKKHAQIMKPKFDLVDKRLSESLNGLDIASWNKPNGGYFISLDVMNGCAKRVGELCKDAGVVLTPVGATYPYGNDPNNSNIRIAPSFPPLDELDLASQVLCLSVKIACAEKLLEA